MTFTQFKWLAFGIGVVVGAIGATVVASRPSYIKDGATTLLSYGIQGKRKIQSAAGVAKENIEDLVAAADQKVQDRENKAQA